MHLFRIIAAVGAAAWAAKKFAGPAKDAYERAGKPGSSKRTTVTRYVPPSGTRTSAAAAAGGEFRDDRDVSGVGALRDEEVSSR